MKDESELFFKVRPDNHRDKINMRMEIIGVHIQKVICKSDESNTATPTEDCYYDPVVIDSCDYQKIKKIPHGGKLCIKMEKDNYLCISDIDATYSSNLTFGKIKDRNDLYIKNFDKDIFRKTAKITGLSNRIQFYSPKIHEYPSYPLMIKVKIGNIGRIMIFIKDETQIKLEGEE